MKCRFLSPGYIILMAGGCVWSSRIRGWENPTFWTTPNFRGSRHCSNLRIARSRRCRGGRACYIINRNFRIRHAPAQPRTIVRLTQSCFRSKYRVGPTINLLRLWWASPPLSRRYNFTLIPANVNTCRHAHSRLSNLKYLAAKSSSDFVHEKSRLTAIVWGDGDHIPTDFTKQDPIPRCRTRCQTSK
jgi:hypothetical protein